MQHTQFTQATPSAEIPSALQHFSSLPPEAYVRLPVVKNLFSIGSASVWRWSASGKLPKPINISKRVTAWNVGQLRETLASMREAV